MTSAKFIFGAVLALAISVAFAGGEKQKPVKPSEVSVAKDLLLRTMMRQPSHNVMAIVVQRTLDEPGTMQQIQVTISRDGKYRQTILQPLRWQGIESVDDGLTARTLIPDKKMIVEMASPRSTPCDAAQRVQLAGTNYKLTLGPTSEIAGRDAVCIVATPKSADMIERRYYVDPKTAYLLKVESVGQSGRPTTTLETKSVSYPREMPDDVFTFRQISGTIKVSHRIPQNVQDPKLASRRLGFDPFQPSKLPYGFIVQDTQVTDPDEMRRVAVRITDGLVKAQVYQWIIDKRQDDVKIEGATYTDVGNIRLMIVGDLPLRAKQKVLASFASGTRRSLDLPLMLDIFGLSVPPGYGELATLTIR
jgi:hypothetical protein